MCYGLIRSILKGVSGTKKKKPYITIQNTIPMIQHGGGMFEEDLPNRLTKRRSMVLNDPDPRVQT